MLKAAFALAIAALLAQPAFGAPGNGLPDPTMTPGATNPAVTQANIRKTICVRGYTRTIRPPEPYTEALKRRQLATYGYADQAIWHYEEDHLIPLEVGGAPRDARNLWPEPRYGEWNAHKKDLLENELHWRVCHGRMSLAEAQRIFARDWIAGYRRYVAGRRWER